MKIQIAAFGIARDILKGSMHEWELEGGASIENLKTELLQKYPEFGKLRSLRFAVNEEYQSDDYVLSEKDEVVIIPPVSGG